MKLSCVGDAFVVSLKVAVVYDPLLFHVCFCARVCERVRVRVCVRASN